MTRTAVVGAGIVGICTAIALADRGHTVTLIDKSAPAQETSRWNAGVLATSSIIPLNNPGLFANVPRLITGRHPGFRLNLSQAPRLTHWGARFLANSRAIPSAQTTAALTALISHSRECHEALCARAKFDGLHRSGWLMLYRGPGGPRRAMAQADLLQSHDVAAQTITPSDLSLLEPNLSPVFSAGVHITQSAHTDPKALCDAYVSLARALGVSIVCERVAEIVTCGSEFDIVGTTNRIAGFDRVVLTLGAWSNSLLRGMSKPLPLAVERGYLQNFATNRQPSRPFLDVDSGYVAATRDGGVQISSGTELTRLNARPDPRPFARSLHAARQALPLGAPLSSDIAVGNRPTLPDSLPVIGRLQHMQGVWIAAGHQHVGFSTSTGTASLLASLMTNESPSIDPKPFNPARFGL